ncbi:M23 family metallopeptidase [Streptomyces sp. A7024]|uniref:M23 family metallopeptidase n=1 Tax=Streptomyces coryli TaxID=1128680 RepID=A0A6G4TZ87_9ACTN|nr:M23 family metallopeptidase [Streptomyces coryli]NGN64766.1 M23 family metallopeptidase [Streptomyces coryli]
MRHLRNALVAVTATIAALLAGLLTAPSAHAAPNFKAPFPCGQSWTYSHHSQEVRLALDFIKNGGGTAGQPNLASAAGTAYRYYEANGAGNYVVIDHGGGWKTYYFHLSSFAISHGQSVSQGQTIGYTGSTGNSSGAHIHYEQLYNGAGQTIHINGQSLAPYPGSYGQRSITSDNGCGGDGKYWVDTFADAPVFASPTSTSQTGTLYKATNYVYCKAWGREIRDGAGNYNHWWLKTDPDVGPANQYVSAYYLSRWGNDEARDNNGTVIPDC